MRIISKIKNDSVVITDMNTKEKVDISKLSLEQMEGLQRKMALNDQIPRHQRPVSMFFFSNFFYIIFN